MFSLSNNCNTAPVVIIRIFDLCFFFCINELVCCCIFHLQKVYGFLDSNAILFKFYCWWMSHINRKAIFNVRKHFLLFVIDIQFEGIRNSYILKWSNNVHYHFLFPVTNYKNVNHAKIKTFTFDTACHKMNKPQHYLESNNSKNAIKIILSIHRSL